MLKLSLIIPVYNEERHMAACLDAIARQTVMPAQVIIVDNNCTDRTIEIAKTYSFVAVIKEKAQGRGHARSAGFDAATGDILGRIDADSKISSNWVETVMAGFNDQGDLMGATGPGYTSIFRMTNRVKGTLYSKGYFWLVAIGYNTPTMWGANMAIRRSAWIAVASDVCLDDNLVHEDQDLSLCMAAKGMKIDQDNEMLVTTNGQSYKYLPKLYRYSRLFSSTRARHARNGNLSSSALLKIGISRFLLPGLAGVLISMLFYVSSIVFFPLDYVIRKLRPKAHWLR